MNCAPAVRKQLMKVPGVKDCEVSFDDSIATVTVVKGTDPETLMDGLEDPFFGSLKK